MSRDNPFSLAGRTALVAGASRGIGLAIAQALAHAGARVILAARTRDALVRAAEALIAEGCEAEDAILDVQEPASVDALAARYPETDILVNVSGANLRKPAETYTENDFDFLMATNLKGLFRLTQGVGCNMIARGHGKIINIGSLTSIVGLPFLAIYSMTKSGIAGMTRGLAAEWGRHNIQVNCIAPGFILTDFNREMWNNDDMKKWLSGAQASPRMGSPEDVAPLAVFLASSGADYITGQVIAVDGGYSTTASWPFKP